MPGFAAPIDPAAWSLSLPGLLTVPDGLRYPGLQLPQLRAQHPLPKGGVRVPAAGVLRTVTDGVRHVVEVQVNPFALRRTAQALQFGVPTFYLALDEDSDLLAFNDGDLAQAGDVIAQATGVGVACAGQDRVARDPALWAAELLDALEPQDRGEWQPFADATQAAAGAAQPPLLLLDHRGAPLETGDVEIASGPVTATATLVRDDGGDLQRTVARMHAADPGTMPLSAVFPPGGGPATLRPQAAGGDFQLARLPDAAAAAGAIDVTPALRHVALTDLTRWFAPQFAASPVPLARYTRGNVLTPYVNGDEYFDELFHRLLDAGRAGPDGGLHLVGGWQTFPDVELVTRGPDDDPDLPLTLEQAARLIGGAGGATRFLSPQFIQLEPLPPVETVELVAFSVIVIGLLRWKYVDFVRTDAAGAVILLALFVLNLIAVTWIVSENGEPLEPNKDAVDILGAVPNAVSRFAPFPATVDDNPASPPLSDWPFRIFPSVRHWGFYHQKFAIVRVGAERFGYVGGIDINPNRLDDARHLARGPYHDVHARVQGPAVRDVELSFQERWTRDGGGGPLAFAPAAAADLGEPGSDAVQVARTYFRAADPSRALPFAPHGDRTIRDTMGEAIARAREFIYIEDQYFTPPADYDDALVAKVQDRAIKALVVVVPAIGDQPFGEFVRSDLVRRLRLADAGAGIVRIGYPRRHFTTPDNELRAASGRLILVQDLASSGGVDPTVVLGPKQRLPQPPFWVAIEGELMYAFNESGAVNPDPEHARVFEVVRGADTRLVSSGPPGPDVTPRPRAHTKGAAATVIDLTGIYVHAKMLIVDDVFVGIGSANLDRRGLYHDGEINVFSVPQALKASRENPVAALRRRLWAEMLDLPLVTAGPLLEDPQAAAKLFDRSPLEGNRYTDVDAYPTHLMYDATSGDGLVLALLRLALVDQVVAFDHAKLFDAIVDPTSALERAG